MLIAFRALFILSLISFVPQYQRILSRGDWSGISLKYVLLNLIVVTEELTLGLHFIVRNSSAEDTIVHSPPTVGDWLNLGQFGVAWSCYLGL
jgi:hypothetical protein